MAEEVKKPKVAKPKVAKPVAEKKPAPAKAVKAEKPAVKAVKAEKPAAKPAPAKPAPKAEVKKPAPAKPAQKAEPKPVREPKPKGKAPYETNGEMYVIMVHGLAGCTKRQIATIQALGLKKIGDRKLHKDNGAIRGMVAVVSHLVKVEKET